MLTVDTISAAQDNDTHAMRAVIEAMEPKITQIATRIGGAANRDEFTQVGRIALWQGMERYTGGTVDNFHAFMYRTIEGQIQEAAREERNSGATGADRDAIKTFAACVKEANGDLDVAEKLTQTLPPKGRRLSPIRANAARMAWEGTVSLDAPSVSSDDAVLADLLVSEYGVPDDLVEASDIARADRDRKINTVRAVIASMGAKQARILMTRWGIEPAPYLGTGKEADESLAKELSTKPATVRVMRSQAHKSFASRYTKVTGLTPCTCEKCNANRAAEGVSL